MGKYDLFINGYDWGPAVDKIVLYSQFPVSPEKIRPEDFKVTVQTFGMDWSTWPNPSISEVIGQRIVTAAYACNKKGEKIQEASACIALEMSVHPEDVFSNPFLYGSDMINHWQKEYKISIRNEKLKLDINELNKKICPLADKFSMGKSVSDDITLSYGWWEPPKHSDKVPMIIWLHGMGEGGTDPYIVLLGNKVVNLITPDVQRCFDKTGGAYVLTPQTPGFWMQTEKNDSSMNSWISPDSKKTESVYTKALFKLIENFVAEHKDIDKNRIYIGGCSNGGYMTVNMLIQYPDYFAAAYPVCQAYPDCKIDEEKLSVLSKQHIWFTQSKDDKTVNPSLYTLPTYKRLIDAGAKDVHLSLFESVTDQTGNFKDKEGKNYKYNGHFSWIYVLNNECKEDNQSIFSWLSGQSR